VADETGTPYSDIFDIFANKITDYDLFSLEDDDIEDFCTKYLKSAIVKFKKCKKDLTDRDDSEKTFNLELNDEEIEILAMTMVVQWITPKILNIENIKQNMSTKDFRLTSQAEHLNRLRDIKKDLKLEITQMLTSYSYNDLDTTLEDLS
jgi:hypothetical protein